MKSLTFAQALACETATMHYEAFAPDAICALEAFAVIFGQYHKSKSGYKWKKLSEAAAYYSIPIEGQHRALADCLTTLAVIKAMANDTSWRSE